MRGWSCPGLRSFCADVRQTRETLELTTDRKEHAQTMYGQPCTASAYWDQWSGTRLIVEVKRPGKFESRRFTLGTKGKIVTTALTMKGSAGQRQAYEFFLRQ